MPAVPYTKAIFVFIWHPHGQRTLACLHVLFPKSTFPEVLVRNTDFTEEMKGYSITYSRVTTSNSAFDNFYSKFLLSCGTSRILFFLFTFATRYPAFLDLLVPAPALAPCSLHSSLYYTEQFGYARAPAYKCTFPTPSKGSTKQSVLLCLDSILAQWHHFQLEYVP